MHAAAAAAASGLLTDWDLTLSTCCPTTRRGNCSRAGQQATAAFLVTESVVFFLQGAELTTRKGCLWLQVEEQGAIGKREAML